MREQTSFAYDITLSKIECGECSGVYAINERYRAQRQEKGGGWHCPYCDCSWGYFGNSENARLKKELEQERERKRLALARENEERARAERAEKMLKAHKTRAKNGVCPCCKRTFKQLAQHMEKKHPTYLASDETP